MTAGRGLTEKGEGDPLLSPGPRKQRARGRTHLPRSLGVAAAPPRPEEGQDARRGEVRTAWRGPHAHGPGPAARRLRTRAQPAGGSGPARDRLGAAGEIAPKWRRRERARSGDPLPRRAARADGVGARVRPGGGATGGRAESRLPAGVWPKALERRGLWGYLS